MRGSCDADYRPPRAREWIVVEGSEPVAMPTGWKNAIFATMDRIAGTRRGERLLTKFVAVAQTSLGAGNHDDEGERTGENRLISAIGAVLPNVVAMDIGANNGSWTLEMRARCPLSRVIAVEPGSQAVGTLRARTAGDDRVQVVEAALGPEDGRATLFGTDASGLQASLRPDLLQRTTYTDSTREMPSEEVRMITVDSLLCNMNESGFLSLGDHVEAAKIDTEGFELDIVQMLMSSTGHADITVVQFEFHMHALAQGHTIGDFANAFGAGFRLFRLAPEKLIPLTGLEPALANYYGFSNWVAVRSAIADQLESAYAAADPRMRRPFEWRR